MIKSREFRYVGHVACRLVGLSRQGWECSTGIPA